jgi:hypothetical protein
MRPVGSGLTYITLTLPCWGGAVRLSVIDSTSAPCRRFGARAEWNRLKSFRSCPLPSFFLLLVPLSMLVSAYSASVRSEHCLPDSVLTPGASGTARFASGVSGSRGSPMLFRKKVEQAEGGTGARLRALQRSQGSWLPADNAGDGRREPRIGSGIWGT